MFHSFWGPRPPGHVLAYVLTCIVFFVYAYVDLLGFWGEAPAAKRFPGYYRGLRERWMRESRCYFFLSHAQKVGGTRTPRKLRL